MKRILAIDGGGIRGIIPARFCQQIEHLANTRVCEMFDLIAGTSTGGIIALGLVRPAEEDFVQGAESLLSLYEKKGSEIFSNPKRFIGNLRRPKYNAKALERAIYDYFKEVRLSQAVKPVMVTCYDIGLRRPIVLRSWEAEKDSGKDCLMREAARATSAAPTYFAPASINEQTLVDGGIYANNPSAVAYAEARQLWPNEEIMLVSVGTGSIIAEPHLYNEAVNWGLARWAQPLINYVFEGVSASTHNVLSQLLPKNRYYRFQPTLREENSSLDNATLKNIDQLKTFAQGLIVDEQENIEQMVEVLARPSVPRPLSVPGILALLSNNKSYGDPEKSEMIRRTAKPLESKEDRSRSWHFHEIDRLEELDDDNIAYWRGIFLAIPYHQYFNQRLIERIVNWVRDGGHLVVTGYELGERHHETNLNQLIYHFGLSLNGDVIVRGDSTSDKGSKDYGKVLHYDDFVDPHHPILREVTHICARNACSLNLEPGSLPLVRVAPNRIREMKPEEAIFKPSEKDKMYVLASPNQVFGEAYQDPYRALLAIAPKGLTGKGRVLSIGTWDFRPNGPEHKCDNDVFIKNIWNWMIDPRSS